MTRTEKVPKLSLAERNTLIHSIRLYYKFVDKDVDQPHMAPFDVIVYADSVKTVEDEPDTYEAMVKISVEHCGHRSHKAHLKFKAKNFNILPVTIEYI